MSPVLAAVVPLAEYVDTFECPTCGGGGEVVVCPPRCDGSHVADIGYPCRDCDETGVVAWLPVTDEDEPAEVAA